MKKLFLVLLVVAQATFSMEPHTRKPKKSSLSTHLDYLNHSTIPPFSISAVKGEATVGCINFNICKRNSAHGHIEYLTVLATHRGMGIGYQLFERAILTLKKKGFRIITWDAIGIDDVSTEELENVYIAYIHKLADVLEFDFIMEKRLGCLETKVTPMKLILKEAGGNYPEQV